MANANEMLAERVVSRMVDEFWRLQAVWLKEFTDNGRPIFSAKLSDADQLAIYADDELRTQHIANITHLGGLAAAVEWQRKMTALQAKTGAHGQVGNG